MAQNTGMSALQLYVTDQLKAKLMKQFGEGKVSANVERILRMHLEDVAEEKKLRLFELNKEIRRFNGEFGTRAELIFIEEMPPMPPKEEGEQ